MSSLSDLMARMSSVNRSNLSSVTISIPLKANLSEASLLIEVEYGSIKILFIPWLLQILLMRFQHHPFRQPLTMRIQ